jgi:hypothetical protein
MDSTRRAPPDGFYEYGAEAHGNVAVSSRFIEQATAPTKHGTGMGQESAPAMRSPPAPPRPGESDDDESGNSAPGPPPPLPGMAIVRDAPTGIYARDADADYVVEATEDEGQRRDTAYQATVKGLIYQTNARFTRLVNNGVVPAQPPIPVVAAAARVDERETEEPKKKKRKVNPPPAPPPVAQQEDRPVPPKKRDHKKKPAAPPPPPLPPAIAVPDGPMHYTQQGGDQKSLVLLRTPFFAALVRRSLRDFGACLGLIRAKFGTRILPLTTFHSNGTLHEHIARSKGVVGKVFASVPDKTETAAAKVKRCTAALDAGILFFQLFATGSMAVAQRDAMPLWMTEAMFGVDDDVERLLLDYRDLQQPGTAWTRKDTLEACRTAVEAARPAPRPSSTHGNKKVKANVLSEWQDEEEEEDAMDLDEPAHAPEAPPPRTVAPVLSTALPVSFSLDLFAQLVMETRVFKRASKYFDGFLLNHVATLYSMRVVPTQRDMERVLGDFLAKYKEIEGGSELTVMEVMLAMHHIARAACQPDQQPREEPSFDLNAVDM